MPHRNGHNNGGAAHHASGNAKTRHLSYNEAGQVCMTVVDPATRKLLIPVTHIYETRAQHRNTLPSLCQLFLTNRCRQGANCYQVHASWEMVEVLRSEVDALPCCCVRHGDPDRAGVRLNPVDFAEFMHVPPPVSLDLATTHGEEDPRGSDGWAEADTPARCLGDVVLYVPHCEFGTVDGEGCIALEDVSYTVALKRLLEEQDPLHIMGDIEPGHIAVEPCRRITVVDRVTGEQTAKVVVDATGCTVCRLHSLDRCRYAEECKFLHLCKEITAGNPGLTQNTAAHGTMAADEANPTTGTHVADADQSGDGAAAALARTPGNPRHPHRNNHGGSSVFTTISRQQQQQQQQMLRSVTSASSFSMNYPTAGSYGAMGPMAGSLPHYNASSFGASASSPPGAGYPAGPYQSGSYHANEMNGGYAGSTSLHSYHGGYVNHGSHNNDNAGSQPPLALGNTSASASPSLLPSSAHSQPNPGSVHRSSATPAVAPAAAMSRRPMLLIPQCDASPAEEANTTSTPAPLMDGTGRGKNSTKARTTTTTATTTANTSDNVLDSRAEVCTTSPLTGRTGTASSTPHFHARDGSDAGSNLSGAFPFNSGNAQNAGYQIHESSNMDTGDSYAAKSYPSTFNASTNMNNYNMLSPSINGNSTQQQQQQGGGHAGFGNGSSSNHGSNRGPMLMPHGKAVQGYGTNGNSIRVVVNRRDDGAGSSSLTLYPTSNSPSNSLPNHTATSTSYGHSGGSLLQPMGVKTASSLPTHFTPGSPGTSSRTVRTWQHNPYGCTVITPSLEDGADDSQPTVVSSSVASRLQQTGQGFGSDNVAMGNRRGMRETNSSSLPLYVSDNFVVVGNGSSSSQGFGNRA